MLGLARKVVLFARIPREIVDLHAIAESRRLQIVFQRSSRELSGSRRPCGSAREMVSRTFSLRPSMSETRLLPSKTLGRAMRRDRAASARSRSGRPACGPAARAAERSGHDQRHAQHGIEAVPPVPALRPAGSSKSSSPWSAVTMTIVRPVIPSESNSPSTRPIWAST